MKATQLITKVIQDVYKKTGITATAGIGTNMYLCKVAMDIVAKHTKADKNGVRIACLDEIMYRKLLWEHRPLTDFWRVGKGYQKKLEANGLYTMGDIAKCSIENEDKLYKLFGINAELLIDHAWGYEPVTIKDIKNYKPSKHSISSGQVLHCPYNFNKAKLIVKEMTELLALELVEKRLATNQIVLTIDYDVNNLIDKNISSQYKGVITLDRYGRNVPKHSHGTINIYKYTSSSKVLIDSICKLYDKIVEQALLIRRITININNVINENTVEEKNLYEQIDLFTNYSERKKEEEKMKKEKELQKSILEIKRKYGKNAILKGMNFEEGGTTIERNTQIGGHKG